MFDANLSILFLSCKLFLFSSINPLKFRQKNVSKVGNLSSKFAVSKIYVYICNQKFYRGLNKRLFN